MLAVGAIDWVDMGWYLLQGYLIAGVLFEIDFFGAHVLDNSIPNEPVPWPMFLGVGR